MLGPAEIASILDHSGACAFVDEAGFVPTAEGALLAGYKAPKYVVIADALPKNPSGKILKRQSREQHKDLGATDPSGS